MLDILLQSMGITTSILQDSSTDIIKGITGPGTAIPPFSPEGYLLLETGDKLILEDGFGFLLLEG